MIVVENKLNLFPSYGLRIGWGIHIYTRALPPFPNDSAKHHEHLTLGNRMYFPKIAVAQKAVV